MKVLRYHIVYQTIEDHESKNYNPFHHWYEGPYSYDQAKVRVEQMNMFSTDRFYTLAQECIDMNKGY